MLVTGALSGIGAAIAGAYAERGHRVLVTDLPPMAESPRLPPGTTTYRQLDVRSEADWSETCRWVQHEWGGLDILVNNAGVAVGGRVGVMSMAEWERIVDINLMGVARGCHTFVPLMVEAGHGHVVNIASAAGFVHLPGIAAYNATKAAVVAITETLHHELVGTGVRVSVVCPTFTKTAIGAGAPGADALMYAEFQKRMRMTRRSPDVVARRVLRGVDRDDLVILTDWQGRLSLRTKRWAQPLYHRGVRAWTRRQPWSQAGGAARPHSTHEGP